MRFLVLTLCSLALAVPGLAKTNKFKRGQSAPSADGAAAAPADSSKEKKADAGKAGDPKGDPKAGAQEGEKKVDLSDLENRYWAAKDTEFTVVQNRLYTKEKKFALTAINGPIVSDTYSTSWNYGLALDYYFSERHGVEVQGWLTSATDSDVTGAFKTTNGFMPDHNKPKGYVGANYVWVPVYAKLSLLEKKILYFDMYFAPGIGMTMLEAETFAQPPNAKPAGPQQQALTLALDVGQQVFISEHWALRLDARNHIYQEKVYQSSTGNERRTKTTFYSSIMFGITFFQ